MPTATTPMTGKEFLDSLDDGREVWIYGERVKKITDHPAFRNSARMLARLYDALHDPARKAILTVPTDGGGYTHAWFRVPYSAAEQLKARDAIAEWARVTYGWMGRSPDYKAALMNTLGRCDELRYSKTSAVGAARLEPSGVGHILCRRG